MKFLEHLKKFFTYFKRAKKAPATIEEAISVKKETGIYLLITIAIMVLFGILSSCFFISPGLIFFVCFVSLIAFLYFGMMYQAINRTIKRMQNLTCNKCGEKLGDLANTTYKEIYRRWVDSNNSNSPSSTLKVTIKFTCTCPKCGAVKSFTEELRSGAVTSKSSNLISTEKLVEDYLNGFIHA